MNHPILFEAKAPIFQNKLFVNKESARLCPVGLIELVWDDRQGCVVNQAFTPINNDYDSSYNNDQGNSERFKTHLSKTLDLLASRLDRDAAIVEIGCGNGAFLDALNERGFTNLLGYDTAYQGSKTYIKKEYISDFSGLQADLIILRHTLEHIQHPRDFLEEMRRASSKKCGKPFVYIEVPSLEWILENNSFYDIFYEHVNYFDLDFFENIFPGSIAFRSFSHQYLSVFASLESMNINHCHKKCTRSLMDALSKIKAERQRIVNYLMNRDLIIFGAGAKGATLCFHLRAAGTTGKIILVDSNPSKQGCYSCGLDIVIQSPDSVVSLDQIASHEVLVMNPNYLDEIRQALGGGVSRIRCVTHI